MQDVKRFYRLQCLIQDGAAIRRVEINQIKFLLLHPSDRGFKVTAEQLCAILNVRRRKILPDDRLRLGCFVRKHAKFRAATERFNAHLTRTGEQIEHARAAHTHLNDVKHGFLDAVGGRTGVHSLHGFQLFAPSGAADDSHDCSSL